LSGARVVVILVPLAVFGRVGSGGSSSALGTSRVRLGSRGSSPPRLWGVPGSSRRLWGIARAWVGTGGGPGSWLGLLVGSRDGPGSGWGSWGVLGAPGQRPGPWGAMW